MKNQFINSKEMLQHNISRVNTLLDYFFIEGATLLSPSIK